MKMKKLFLLILLIAPSLCWGQFATLSPGGTSDSIGVDVGSGAMDSWLYPAYLREGTNVTFTVTGDTLTIAGQVGAGTADTTWIHNDADDDPPLDWIVDDSKFRNTFDFESTPLDIAMSETIEWYKQNR